MLDVTQRDAAARLAPTLGALGVCPRCVLRFAGVSDEAQYARSQADVWAELRGAAGSEPAAPCAEAGACCVCLGMLALVDDAESAPRLLAELTAASIGARRFAFDVAMPSSILVRQRGAFLHANASVGRERMLRYDAIVDAKGVLKGQFSAQVAATLDALRDDASPYRVLLTVEHVACERESEAIVDASSRGARADGGKRQRVNDPSASSMRSVLKALSEPDCRARLERAGLCPPPAGVTPCSASLRASHAPVCIGGRYNKYSREMPQTPWWLDNEKRGISSVQEELQTVLQPAYAASATVFHGAGREDVDVRMLGSGRPFVIEMQEPACLEPGTAVGTPLAELEAAINLASEHVQVSQLRVVPSSSIGDLVREGESEHRKAYRCVVWLSRRVSAREVADKLDGAGEVLLEQRTPIRVLHRRPLLTRPRTVYSMRSELLNGHYLMLDLVTQSGTYVKEFVHGDFGRTHPNVGSLLGCSADILQLDVLSILDER